MTDPQTQAAAMADAACGVLRMARSLVQSRRTIDLGGLQDNVGRLCAATFDLEYREARAIRPKLAAVLAELDALETALHTAAGRGKEQ
jgi:hypothetical protein